MRTLKLPILLSAVVAFLLPLVLAAPTFGATSAVYSGASFGPDGTTLTSFAALRGIAVDQSTGIVYAYDAGAGAVYKFDIEGNPTDFASSGTNVIAGVGGAAGGSEYEMAVAPAGAPGGTAGDIYVANNAEVEILNSSGILLGTLSGGEGCGVATDSAGHVFVGFFPEVTEFIPTSNPPTNSDRSTSSVAGELSTCNVAADGSGNIYTAAFTGGINRLEGLSDTSPQLIDSVASTLAIDPATNELFANRGAAVAKYSAAGSLLATFAEEGAGQIRESRGIAVNGSSGVIYVSSGTSNQIEIFTPALLPMAQTVAADGVGKNTATLHGVVGADGGPEASCEFQYTKQTTFEAEGFGGAQSAACAPPGPFAGTGSNTVEAALSGLTSGTEYRFRAVSTSSSGRTLGEPLGFATPEALGLQTGEAASLAPNSAVVEGSINPDGVAVQSCAFEYGPDASYGQSVPCQQPDAAEIGEGTQSVPVRATLTSLAPNQGYHFRLVASNSFGTSRGGDEFFETLGPPRVTRPEIANVTLTSASVSGSVNPDGELTTVFIDYVPEASYAVSGFAEAVRVPVEGQEIGSGRQPVEVRQQLEGLSSFTTYRVRIYAVNAAGQSESAAEAFTTFIESASSLPDGRAYEQASPVEKNGSNVGGGPGLVQAAAQGGAITFFSTAGIPGGEGAQIYPSYLSARSDAGWSTEGLLPPASLGNFAEVIGWNEGLTTSYTFAGPFSGARTIYSRSTATHELFPIKGSVKGSRSPILAAATRDGSSALFESNAQLMPTAPPGTPNSYLYDAETHSFTQVDVFNDGTAPPEGAFAGPYDWYLSGSTENGGPFTNYYTQATNVLSFDGSRAFFTAAGTGQLYARVNAAAPQSPVDGTGRCLVNADACTVTISSPNVGVTDPNGHQPAAFISATPSGEKVFFISREKLTADATTGPADGGRDLYMYDFSSGSTIDLVSDQGDANGADVQGVIGTSDDGSYVYFLANGVLAPGASSGNCELRGGTNGSTGFCSLYVAHGGTISFISRLNASTDANNAIPVGNPALGEREGSVSSNGTVLLFRSSEQLSQYDNHTTSELYRYDAESRALICISCDPTGVAPVGAASLQSISSFLRPISEFPVITRNLSASGNRIFFETPDALVAADSNGANGCPVVAGHGVRACQDVYEWEAPNEGSCKSASQDGGCLYLISAGATTAEPAYFADADTNGANVFFFTSAKLVLQDQDELTDVYDARVGGGISDQNQVPPPPCLNEGSCRAGYAPPSVEPVVGSEALNLGTKHHRKKHHRKKHHHITSRHSKTSGKTEEGAGQGHGRQKGVSK